MAATANKTCMHRYSAMQLYNYPCISSQHRNTHLTAYKIQIQIIICECEYYRLWQYDAVSTKHCMPCDPVQVNSMSYMRAVFCFGYWTTDYAKCIMVSISLVPLRVWQICSTTLLYCNYLHAFYSIYQLLLNGLTEPALNTTGKGPTPCNIHAESGRGTVRGWATSIKDDLPVGHHASCSATTFT